jgi:hypothetical protein
MKKQKFIIVTSIIVLMMALTGCKKEAGFTVGEWNGNTYENTWLNMKFAVPTEWKIATDEEINALVGAGADAMIVKGTSAEQLKAAAKLKTIYAFMVSDSTGVMAQLMYENLLLTIGGSAYDETKYMDALYDILVQQVDFQYEFIEEGSLRIANKEFKSMKLSAFGGALYQEFYCYKMDTFMVAIALSYTPEKENAKIEFLNNIKTLK